MRPVRHPFALLLIASGLVGLVGLSGCAHDEQSADPVLKDLEFVGTEQVSAGEIKERIVTSETSWIPFSKKKRFDPNVWRTDLERIERYYQARGYFQANVVSSEVIPDGENAVKVRVQIEEGEPTIITGIQVDGGAALAADQQALLADAVPFSQGEVFLEETWEALEESLAADLREQGYARAGVKSLARVDLETREATLDIQVDAGTRYKFGDITLRNHTGERVEDWRIIEQAREAIEDEEWYSDTARDEAQARVFAMEVFGAATVSQGEAHPETGVVDLEVEVQEAPLHTLRAGFGVGIDQARNDVHAIAGYTDRDFLGGLRRLELESRAGWAFLPNAYSVARGGNTVTQHGPIARLSADLLQPRLFHPNFSGTSRLEFERALEPAYAYFGGRGRLGVNWTPWSWLTITPSYNLELYRLDQGEVQRSTETAGAPNLLYGCAGGCVLSYLEQALQLDRRDDIQEPKNGYLLALSFQEGGRFLGGTFDYLRVLPEVRGYVSMLENQRLTLSARVRAGTLVPLSGGPLDSPIVARFFSGGNFMRGFSSRRLSPMLLIPTPEGSGEFEAEPLPIGGNGLFETQLEVRYDLTANLIGALFTDFGIVTSEQLQVSTLGQLQMAVGGGVRYRTPIGPIRLDLAYRPNVGAPLQVYSAEEATPLYRESQGCFGFGEGSPDRAGAPEGPCSIHLSIGEAF